VSEVMPAYSTKGPLNFKEGDTVLARDGRLIILNREALLTGKPSDLRDFDEI